VGEPAVVIAAADHRQEFLTELERHGHDVEELHGEGLLTSLDADKTLAALMDGDVPSPIRFEKVVGGTIDEIARRFPGRTVRAFGEMVDLLVQRGQAAAAAALEDLWNEILESRRFALLCGYQLDVFDLEAQASVLPEVVRAHTHTRPVAEPARLGAAVHQTLTDVLGSDATAWIYLRVAEEIPLSALPRAQAVLMWLSRHQPKAAQRVLQAARARYAAAT
jgi:KaiC/GvpD/RAD55 family RecA-like ATPase